MSRPTRLWEALEQASTAWDDLGQPTQQVYHLEIHDEKADLLVADARLPL
jgi:hypothetical protein